MFKFDPDFEANEEKYVELKKEMLASSSSSSDGDGESGSSDSDSDSHADEEGKLETSSLSAIKLFVGMVSLKVGVLAV